MNETVHEIINTLLLAVRSHSSLFLVVYYEHESDKNEFLKRLQQEFDKNGLNARIIDPVHNPEHGIEKVLSLLAAPPQENEINLLTQLPRTQDSLRLDGKFLGYLNFHRDEMFESRLRLLLFMHQSDTEQFIHEAGDLWDFRQRSYWLESKAVPQSEILWKTLDQVTSSVQLSPVDHSKIEEHQKEVRALVNQTPGKQDKAGLMLDLTGWLLSRYAAPLAVESALEGIAFIKTERSKLRAQLEHELGYALKLTANLSESLRHYLISLEISREIDDQSGMVKILKDIARIYSTWGQYQEALKFLEESLAMSITINNRRSECISLSDIAFLYSDVGRKKDAIETWENALVISKEIGDIALEGVIINNIATIYMEQGRHEEALKSLGESLIIKRQVGDRGGEIISLNNIGRVYVTLKRYEDALPIFEKSLLLSREIGSRELEGMTIINIGRFYFAVGRLEEGLNKMEESLQIFREVGNSNGVMSSFRGMAILYESQGNIIKAIEMLRKAIEIEESIQYPKIEEDKKLLKKLEEKIKTTHS